MAKYKSRMVGKAVLQQSSCETQYIKLVRQIKIMKALLKLLRPHYKQEVLSNMNFYHSVQ